MDILAEQKIEDDRHRWEREGVVGEEVGSGGGGGGEIVDRDYDVKSKRLTRDSPLSTNRDSCCCLLIA